MICMDLPPTGVTLPVDRLPAVAGTYALLLCCRQARLLQIGRRGSMRLAPGCYIYVGSAFGPGGLRARLAHHLRLTDRPHWHLDYLRMATYPQAIWFSTAQHRQEHLWAQLLANSRGARIPLPGFGSTDCRCVTHLFFFSGTPSFDGFRRRLRRTSPETPPAYRLPLDSA